MYIEIWLPTFAADLSSMLFLIRLTLIDSPSLSIIIPRGFYWLPRVEINHKPVQVTHIQATILFTTLRGFQIIMLGWIVGWTVRSNPLNVYSQLGCFQGLNETNTKKSDTKNVKNLFGVLLYFNGSSLLYKSCIGSPVLWIKLVLIALKTYIGFWANI